MHTINRLYSEEFDFNSNTESKITFMIATTPRSGSTLLGINLWRTGLMGAPMEYLNFPVLETNLLPRFGYPKKWIDLSESELLDYWNRIKLVRTSANGVFGYKVFMQNFFYVVTKFHGFFEQVQPDYIIYLSRDDTLKQAISYSRALQTHAWFHDVVDSVDATYDFNHITQCFDVLKSQNEYWEEVFKMANVIPIRIKYEDFVESPSSVIARVAEKMNLQIDESKMLDIPLLERQSDPITTQWKLKYLEDSENK